MVACEFSKKYHGLRRRQTTKFEIDRREFPATSRRLRLASKYSLAKPGSFIQSGLAISWMRVWIIGSESCPSAVFWSRVRWTWA